MLTTATIERILDRLSGLRLGVVGDLFLDRYLDIDAALTEPSVETGLDAYQVTRVRSYPGAAGTVINNLAALGVGAILPVAILGDDGEGHELRQALARLPAVDGRWLFACAERRTPTYTKPMLNEAGHPPRELNRLDIKNRTPLPADAETRILGALEQLWPTVDALLVLDQVREAECGVVTSRIRERLAVLGQRDPRKLILVDSRERVGLFRFVTLKPNEAECLRAAPAGSVEESARELVTRTGRPVLCTCGERGILAVEPGETSPGIQRVPACRVSGPIDIVGAGDSTSAGIACAVAAGASLLEAAALGNLVASITIQQIGVTGTASPEQVRQQWGRQSARR